MGGKAFRPGLLGDRIDRSDFPAGAGLDAAQETPPYALAFEWDGYYAPRALHRLLAAGVAAGAFRTLSVPDLMQTLIGATVYHFASGEFGEDVLGAPLFSADAVRRRKSEVVDLLRAGLAVQSP